jgi:peptidyl-prolyl cis-trans isomerase SurA
MVPLGLVYAEPTMINGVAVIVNDAIITYQDVIEYVGPSLNLLRDQLGNQPQALRQRETKLLKDGTDQLVERQLILHDFKTAGYNLPESIIEDTINERIKQRFGDRLTLIKHLKAEGVTIETYRQRTRDEIVIEQMRYFHVSKELIISPQKILKYYQAHQTNYSVADQVKLRMIVLNKPSGGDGGATKELAKEILDKIKGGASFEEMARIHSEGSQKAVGGSWDWVERSVLRKELADVAFTLKQGATSEVIDLPDACFIMLVEDMRTAHVKPLVEVRDEIEKNLVTQERARLQDKWIDRLRSKSFVRYF